MKKYVVFAALTLAGIAPVSAQSAKRTTAYNALETYKREKNPADLTKAKANIDEAMQDAGVAGETKSWVYKGNIYVAVFERDLGLEKDKITDVTDAGKKTMMAYSTVSSSELTDAVNAYVKGWGMDTKKAWTDDLRTGLGNCYNHSFNLGLSYYNNKKYAEAIPAFEQAALIAQTKDNRVDTNALNNAALCAYYGNSYDKGIELYKKLADAKVGKAKTWMSMARMYEGKGDQAGYKSAISQGLALYPQDADLLTADINNMLKDNKFQEAVDKLTKLIEQKQDDANLRFVVGNVYDRIANPTDKDGNFTDKPANFEDMTKKAVEQYTKATELKPDYFDAFYNLGILNNNIAAEYSKRASAITGTDKASIAKKDELDKKTNESLKAAETPLEKAHTIQPKDRQTMQALKQVYGLLGETDKYMKMKEELKNN